MIVFPGAGEYPHMKEGDMLSLLDKFTTIQPTQRMKRLRETYIENSKRTDPVYTIYFDRAIARVMKETEGEPMVLRRAKAFAAAVREMPVEHLRRRTFCGLDGRESRPCRSARNS